ncbi:MAG: hypothetical protein AAB642_03515 [Patescibacteria group bacterium]
MRIGEVIRIIVVEPFEDSTEVPADSEDRPIRDSEPQEILLEGAEEVMADERASDLLPV